MRKFPTLLPLILLAGCAGASQALEYDTTTHYVQMPDDTYRVFEHPKHDRIMTTPSLGKTTTQGLARGLTLGAGGPTAPLQLHEAAARKYLDDTGRTNCRITSGRLLFEPQYEFMLDCS